MKDRSFRGDDREPGRKPGVAFDPVVEGAKYGLSADMSQRLWKTVQREATDREGLCDE